MTGAFILLKDPITIVSRFSYIDISFGFIVFIPINILTGKTWIKFISGSINIIPLLSSKKYFRIIAYSDISYLF